MIATYEELTEASVAWLGVDDPAHACVLLQEMAGHDVPDTVFNGFLSVITEALAACADPDRATKNLARWAEGVGSRAASYQLLTALPAAAQGFIDVSAASQLFADWIIGQPEYLEVLTNPALGERGRTPETVRADLARRVAIAKTPNAKRDALRRAKKPEVLQIGVRDLLGLAEFSETVRAISAFADSCVQIALEICENERGLTAPPFAVIALGKLGGRELNYASDIDLIFVHGDAMPEKEAAKLGEAVRDALSKTTDAGFVFRVDLRLRPEGRFGPISRSLASCRAYYESWAEPWERQALLKARFVAGDAEIGEAFIRMTQEYAYPQGVEQSFVDSIRQNKRRLEQKIAHAGEADTNVKEGFGGIRDIEFAVQLLQLIGGGRHPALRVGDTLTALHTLSELGWLTGSEQSELASAYVFLRVAEHRLQLMDERAERNLPRNPRELDKFGKRLGYPNGAAFLAEYKQQTGRAHALFTRLFYGETAPLDAVNQSDSVAEWVLATDSPKAQSALYSHLITLGFADPDAALKTLRHAVRGSEYGEIVPDDRAAFAPFAGKLLDAAAQTDDSDAALRGLDALAQSVPSRAALYLSLRSDSVFLPRLCCLAASSPPLWQMVLTHPEYLDRLADEELMDAPYQPLLSNTLPELASAMRGARLHGGSRDIWGLSGTAQVMAETTQAAEVALSAALDIARRETGFEGAFAIIGLGKLGGLEMGYGSDMDVFYVAEPGCLGDAARLAERLQQILKTDLTRYGTRWDIDARLRPDGRKGALVLDLATYRAYYANSAATWERHALIKARPVAGDAALGQAFAALASQIVYGAPWTSEQLNEVRTMKQRIETERLKDPNDLKLGPGGLSDIEWTTQLLQLKHGPRRSRLRAVNTVEALRRLRDDALITQADWETLSETYLCLTQFRNRQFLKTGLASNAIPELPDALAVQREAVRAIVQRVFYGEGTSNE